MKLFLNTSKPDRMLVGFSMVCLALALILLGVKDRQLRAAAAEDEDFIRFVDVASEIYNEIETKFVDEVDGKEVLEGALQGMFSRLDEHSVYLDPKTLDSLNKDTGGEFSGIGIHITMRQGLLTVIAPIPGSPSARLGLAPWDRIIEIDGETTEGMSLQDAVDKLTGPAGTQVTIKVFREGEPDPLEFTITREQIKIDSVYHNMLESDIGYIRIARFSENTAADMRKAILDLQSQGMKSLLVDLRFNTGGLLREAIDVSDLFVPKNEMIVSTKGRLRSQNREYHSEDDPIVKNTPTFVLVNEGSASASEIFAGAMQDHHLAVIIGPKGQNTFGKGSVQTIESLRHTMYDDENGNPMDSAIKLTTARYYTPSGRTIHKVGITPDIGIPLPQDNERELLRHGMYGDTVIPMTVEEKEAMEEMKAKQNTETPSPEPGTPLEEGIEIQRQPDAKKQPAKEGAVTTPPEGDQEDAIKETTKPADDSTEPFYANVKTPELVKEDDFHDVMLDEAVKLMKVYNILDTARKGGETTNFADAKNDKVSLAN